MPFQGEEEVEEEEKTTTFAASAAALASTTARAVTSVLHSSKNADWATAAGVRRSCATVSAPPKKISFSSFSSSSPFPFAFLFLVDSFDGVAAPAR